MIARKEKMFDIYYSEIKDRFFEDRGNIYADLILNKYYSPYCFNNRELKKVSVSFIALKYQETKVKIARRNMQIRELKKKLEEEKKQTYNETHRANLRDWFIDGKDLREDFNDFAEEYCNARELEAKQVADNDDTYGEIQEH